MRRSLALLLCVLAVMASAEARFHPFHWEVKSELDIHKNLVITINGRTPGPLIQVQQGDIIGLKVTNSLVKENLPIIWHGLRGIGSPWCDGTNGPILAGETCTYRFVADQAGEYSYESEYRMQKLAGLYGPIRVLP